MNIEKSTIRKLAVGGGCHWCTEAVFQMLKGVSNVKQGYISRKADPEIFYEGILFDYDPEIISLEDLIKVHLVTHKSKSNHSMRNKYLSAIYIFNEKQRSECDSILSKILNTSPEIITRIYNFEKFKASRKEITNYYNTDPERPFCKTYIDPKLKHLEMNFTELLRHN